MPVACLLVTTLNAVETPVAGGRGRAGKLALNVRNVSDVTVTEKIEVKALPEGSVKFAGEPVFEKELKQGEESGAVLEFTLNEEHEDVLSRIEFTSAGANIRPACARVMAGYILPELSIDSFMSDPGKAMRDGLSLPVKAVPRIALKGHYADVKIACAGDMFLIQADMKEKRIDVTPLIWDGSCVEIFCASPDVERLGNVFGNLKIGQVYLVPEFNGQPARALRFKDGGAHEIKNIPVFFEKTGDGYRLYAGIPLAELEVGADMDSFLFEIQVNTSAHEGYLAARANLFGSQSAFNDTSSYALAVRERAQT